MKIILMYDLPMSEKDESKSYRVFHNNIIKRGYIMMQYSFYYKTINTKTKFSYELKHLKKIVPEKGHIRAFTITEKQFWDFEIIRGNRNINEEINNNERYIKINEDIWK